MKILAGVYQPDSGSIEIHGRTEKFAGPADAIACGVSMIYQELNLAEHLTVAENVFLGAEPTGRMRFVVNRRKMYDQTRDLADRFSFETDPTAKVEDLPTGDCQIVEILKALRRNASVIVMDEPTSCLSEREVKRLFQIVRQLRTQGLSVIYISHRLEEIVDLADDVTVLRDGKLVASEPMARLDIGKIVKHMVGRELSDYFPTRKAQIGPVLVSVKNLSAPSVIKDVSFDIRRGEIIGMAGLVGAGRTEVARAVFGIDKKTTGRVSLDDEELNVTSPAQAIAKGIAYLTEDRKRTGLCLQLPCTWNITLPNLVAIGMKTIIRPSREKGIAEAVARQIAVRWSSPTAPAESLSGGNQQKLLIARWLLAKSRFIIFDEPTKGIDVGAKTEVYNLLNKLAEQGKAILFISSELPELFGITDRILVMRRGRLVGDLVTRRTTPEQVMHLAAVEES